jgi:hypothetical protein
MASRVVCIITGAVLLGGFVAGAIYDAMMNGSGNSATIVQGAIAGLGRACCRNRLLTSL